MLKRLSKTSSFTKWLTPDERVPTIEAAKSAGDDLLRTARNVTGSFTWVTPEKRPEIRLVGVSPAMMEELGLPEGEEKTEEFQRILSGQEVLEDVYPWAQAYAGWQFGQWAGQLGDGRAISLFETTTKSGRRYEVQLKGAGRTPYSRFADGKAVVRSSVREMLGSEAVNALGIPTTRALSLICLPETRAHRYFSEECAIVARAAESWVRFGTFDLHKAKGNRKELRKLADYCIDEVFKLNSSDPKRYFNLYKEIALRNARGLALWQTYGLLNGVINTDNTSILGLFLDYGPFGFMDTFDASFTSNHDDGLLRYAYKNVPTALWWNLVRLGEDLAELLGAGELIDDAQFIEKGATDEQKEAFATAAEEAIKQVETAFKTEFLTNYKKAMTKRLALKEERESDLDDLFTPLLDMLQACNLDYNQFFRKLGDYKFGDDVGPFFPKQRDLAPELTLEEAQDELKKWLDIYKTRVESEKLSDDQRQAASRAVNPKFVLKTWLLNEVIESVNKGETEYFEKVMTMSLAPFSETWGFDEQFERRLTGEVPRMERGIQCECSS